MAAALCRRDLSAVRDQLAAQPGRDRASPIQRLPCRTRTADTRRGTAATTRRSAQLVGRKPAGACAAALAALAAPGRRPQTRSASSGARPRPCCLEVRDVIAPPRSSTAGAATPARRARGGRRSTSGDQRGGHDSRVGMAPRRPRPLFGAPTACGRRRRVHVMLPERPMTDLSADYDRLARRWTHEQLADHYHASETTLRGTAGMRPGSSDSPADRHARDRRSRMRQPQRRDPRDPRTAGNQRPSRSGTSCSTTRENNSTVALCTAVIRPSSSTAEHTTTAQTSGCRPSTTPPRRSSRRRA